MVNKNTVGVFCGEQSGKTIVVTGNYVVLTFHSDSYTEEKGFQMIFIPFPPSKYNRSVACYFLRTQFIVAMFSRERLFYFSQPNVEISYVYAHKKIQIIRKF